MLSNSNKSVRGSSMTFQRKDKATVVIPVDFGLDPFEDITFNLTAPKEMTSENLGDWLIRIPGGPNRTSALGMRRRSYPSYLPRGWVLVGKKLRIPPGSFHLSKDVVIDEDLHVTIGPETNLVLGESVSIFLRGEFDVRGLRIEPTTPSSKTWRAVVFSGHGKNSRLRNINIKGGSGGIVAQIPTSCSLCLYGGSYEIEGLSIISSEAEDGVNTRDAIIRLRNSHFGNMRSDGLDCDSCDLHIRKTSFEDVGGDAIDVSHSSADIVDSTFCHVKDKAVSVGEGSSLIMRSSRIRLSSVGVAVKDSSAATLEANEFIGCPIDLAAYRKKSIWVNGGKIRLINNKTDNSEIKVDGLSKITPLAD